MTPPGADHPRITIAADHRTLNAEEARRYLDAPITDAERDGILELARWFRRRYAAPAARLAYVRRAFARWHRTRGIAAGECTRPGPDPCHASRRERQP